MKEEYTADTLEHIWADVQEVQKDVRSRKLEWEDIYKAGQIMFVRPYGTMTIDAGSRGRCLPQSGPKTVLVINWYTWRGKKWARWLAYRTAVKEEDAGSDIKIEEDYDKATAWEALFPERYNKYRSLMYKRKLTGQGIVVPQDAEIERIIDERYGMALIYARLHSKKLAGIPYYSMHLCSPAGCIEVRYCTRVYTAARYAGIQLPKNTKKRTWENIEPLWIMAAMSKL